LTFMNPWPFFGAIGALMNIVLQPRPLVVLGLNVWMGTDAGADAAAPPSLTTNV